MTTRKLIRPNLTEIKEKLYQTRPQAHAPSPAPAPAQGGGGHYAPQSAPAHPPRPRKAVPPESTSAEAFYYLKQMNAKTPMIVVLTDGEELRGVIEWYDRGAIKVNRFGAPNLLVMKRAIRYMYKAEELQGLGPAAPDNGSGPGR
jgi:sRNA-binding regulator protein Hfq